MGSFARRSPRQLPGSAPAPPHLLSGLPKTQSKHVFGLAEHLRVAAGETFIRIGNPAAHLFLLKRGRAKFYRITKTGEEVLLWWLAKGDAVGLGTLMTTPVRYIGTAQAIDDCELIVWKRVDIQSLARHYHRLAQNALDITLHCVATYTERLTRLATGTAEERLAHALLHLAERVGVVGHTGVELAILNEDLAGLADVSTFTASRQLKAWERQGVLEKSRGRVRILSPEGLIDD